MLKRLTIKRLWLLTLIGSLSVVAVIAHVAGITSLLNVNDGNVAKIGDTNYSTLQAAFDAASDGDVITLLADYDATGTMYSGDNRFNLWVSKGITIDGDNKTLAVKGRGIGVQGASGNIDVTFKDITIKNIGNENGRCIDTRGKLGSLTLSNSTLTTAESAYTSYLQPLTIGGNQATAADVTITNSKIIVVDNANKGYAITTFNPVNMAINGSTVKGWACLNIKGADGSAGSAGSVITVGNNSTLVSANGTPGYSNAYSLIKIEDDNVNVAISGSTINVNGGDNTQSIVSFQKLNQTNSANCNVSLGENNTVTLEGDYRFATNVGSNSVFAITGGTFNVDPVAYCADGYSSIKVGDAWSVGKVSTTDLTEQPGATDTQATYQATTIVTDENNVQHTVNQEVTVAVQEENNVGEDVTLSDFDMSDVVAKAVAAANSTNDIDVQLIVKAADPVVSGETVTFEVHPEAIITVNSGIPTNVELTNDDLANNASFTFKLDVTGKFENGTTVQVVHKSEGYDDETYYATVVDGMVTVSGITHFSNFELSAITPQEGMVAVNLETGTQYASLKAAVEDASPGATIALIADDNVSLAGTGSEIVITKPITITGEVNSNGEPKWTVYGSSNGVLNNQNFNDLYITSATGTVTVSNIKFSGFGNAINSVMGHAPVFVGGANNNAVIDNVYISNYNCEAIHINGGSFEITNCNIDGSKTTDKNDYTKGICIVNEATGSITGTTITNVTNELEDYAMAGIELQGRGPITIDNCTISTNAGLCYGICANSAEDYQLGESSVTVSNTTVTSPYRTVYGDGTNGALITIESGTYTGDLLAEAGANSQGLSVSGGTFDAPVPEEYCAEGYIPTGQDPVTGLYTVKQGSYVAQVTVGETTTKYETLAEAWAVANANAGSTLKMLDADDTTSQLEVSGTFTLDFNGCQLQYIGTSMLNSGVILVLRGAHLTLEDTSEEGLGGIVSDIISYNIDPDDPEPLITVEDIHEWYGDVSYAYAAIALTKNGETSTDNAVLTVNGGELYGHYYGIVGNGGRHGTEITVNGGNIIGAEGTAIYHPQNGTLTITDGTFTGKETGIELRSGTLNVTGGTFETQSTEYSCNPNGSGTTTVGAAIAIAQHTTNQPIQASIEGGTFIVPDNSEAVKLSVSNPENNTFSNVSVSGLTELIGDRNKIPNGYVWVENNGISTLNKAVAQIGNVKYATLQAALDAAASQSKTIGEQVTVTLLQNVTDGYGLALFGTAANGANVKIDFGGYTYTVAGPAVGSSGTQNQALHFEEGSNVTLYNGTINMTSDATALADFQIFMQNYGTLIIDKMTIDGTGIAVAHYGNTFTGDWAVFNGTEKPQFNYNNAGSSVIRNSTITMPGDMGIDDAAALTIEDDAVINVNKIATKGTDERYASATPTIAVENGAKFKLVDADGAAAFESLLNANGQSLGTADADGVYTVEAAKVAQIGNVKYASLAAAIAAVADGDEIEMIANSQENVLYDVTSPNLKNKTVTISGAYTLTSPSGNFGFYFGDYDGGNRPTTDKLIVSDITMAKSGGNYTTLFDGVTADLTNVTVNGDGNTALSYANGAVGTLTNVTVTNTGNHSQTWRNTALAVQSIGAMSEVTVKSGSYTSENGYAVYMFSSGGKLNIEGGTFSGALISQIDNNTYPGKQAIINISGGTFTNCTLEESGGDNAQINISGGTFDVDPTTYVATGYEAVNNGNGTWTVQEASVIIGDIILIDGEDYKFALDKNVTGQITYQRSFDSNHVGVYQSWLVPFDYMITAADVQKFQFYKINMVANSRTEGNAGNVDENTVFVHIKEMGEGEILYHNKPYIIKTLDGYTTGEVIDFESATGATLYGKRTTACNTTETSVAAYNFYATYEPTYSTKNHDFLYISGSGRICWSIYPWAYWIDPYRWIIKMTAKNENYAPVFGFITDEDGATGIRDAEFVSDSDIEGYYTLNGVKVETPSKGVYIVKYNDGRTKKINLK